MVGMTSIYVLTNELLSTLVNVRDNVICDIIWRKFKYIATIDYSYLFDSIMFTLYLEQSYTSHSCRHVVDQKYFTLFIFGLFFCRFSILGQCLCVVKIIFSSKFIAYFFHLPVLMCRQN